LKEQFDGDASVKVSLAPPLLAQRDKATGHLRKRKFGGWILRAFDILTRPKFLRHLDTASQQDWPRLVALAKSADLVRGYGHIKEANVARYRQECARLEGTIGQPVAQAAE
jgi:indolepyruvate ferredoxin oxidoreductase